MEKQTLYHGSNVIVEQPLSVCNSNHTKEYKYVRLLIVEQNCPYHKAVG